MTLFSFHPFDHILFSLALRLPTFFDRLRQIASNTQISLTFSGGLSLNLTSANNGQLVVVRRDVSQFGGTCHCVTCTSVLSLSSFCVISYRVVSCMSFSSPFASHSSFVRFVSSPLLLSHPSLSLSLSLSSSLFVYVCIYIRIYS